MSAERQLILNVDDVGMCHGANVAYLELKRAGAVDSGSVMVPCPWFLEIAELGAADPSLALGVHITLTSEKRHYRWRPLTKPGKAGGLVDGDGYMWRSVPELRVHAHPDAVEAEMRAQIDMAQAAGLQLTHMDGHMGAAFSPEFAARYVAVGLDYALPTLFPEDMRNYGPIHNLGPVDFAAHKEPARRLAAAGAVFAREVLETPWHRDATARARYETLLGKVGAGLNFVCLHPNAPGEINVIEPSSAQIRIDEYELLGDADFMRFVAGLNTRRGSLQDFWPRPAKTD